MFCLFCDKLQSEIEKLDGDPKECKIYLPIESPVIEVKNVIRHIDNLNFDFGRQYISYCPYCGKILF